MLDVYDWHARDNVEVGKRLTARGFFTVSDWGGFPCQVTGRIPPNGEWFYFRERSGRTSIAIYPPDRYPFASPESGANTGWDAMHLGEEPPVLWEHICDTPETTDDVVALTEELIVRLVDLWRASRGEGR